MGDAAAVRGQAVEVARGWSPPGAPESWRLTATLFTTLADSPDLLEAAAAAISADRLPALLFSAAALRLVHEERPANLVGYLPEPGRAGTPVDASFAPAWTALCRRRLPDVLTLAAGHRYQMNEVARATQLALGVGVALAEEPGRRWPSWTSAPAPA